MNGYYFFLDVSYANIIAIDLDQSAWLVWLV